MNGLAHHVVAAEGERQVADAAADLHPRAGLLDLPRRLDEVLAVVVMFFEAGGNGQDVRVEDDVGRIDAGLFGQQLVGAGADLEFALDRVGLALLVERHHDHRRAVATHQVRLRQEVGFAFLQADRIDDRLALHALEAGLDHRPLRAVDHDRQPGDLGFGADVVQELGPARFRIEHALVHVDVDDVGAAADLVECDAGRTSPVERLHQPLELLRAGDVGALADHLEVAIRTNHQRFQTRQCRVVLGCWGAGVLGCGGADVLEC